MPTCMFLNEYLKLFFSLEHTIYIPWISVFLSVSSDFKIFSGSEISLKWQKNHFFMENFLKKSKTGDSFSTNDSSFIYSFIGTLKSLFYASTCQPKRLVSTTLYVIVYSAMLFHLLPYRGENEYMKVPTLLKKRVLLTNLVHLM